MPKYGAFYQELTTTIFMEVTKLYMEVIGRMEFNEKLQELRKQKGLTQEELSELLFVSRTAISKWESGRGYPSIDSLKAISDFFCVTIDELLSGRELISIAEKDSARRTRHMRDLVFALLDCAAVVLIFIPFFGQRDGDFIRMVSLIDLTEVQFFIKLAYYIIVVFTVVWGVLVLALQNWSNTMWVKNKNTVSICLSLLGVLLFMISLEPYAACFVFVLLIIKGVLLIKRL